VRPRFDTFFGAAHPNDVVEKIAQLFASAAKITEDYTFATPQ